MKKTSSSTLENVPRTTGVKINIRNGDTALVRKVVAVGDLRSLLITAMPIYAAETSSMVVKWVQPQNSKEQIGSQKNDLVPQGVLGAMLVYPYRKIYANLKIWKDRRKSPSLPQCHPLLLLQC